MEFKGIKSILTDIEGTVTSISFVKDVLFPYSEKNLAKFLNDHHDDEQVREIIAETINLADQEIAVKMNDVDKAVMIMKSWIEADKKIKALKDLQGLIWENGYKQKDYYGHLYQDAYEKLKEWYEQGIPLYIYSSGSVYAQKLLFGHTEYGDLSSWFKGNFDTKIGHKREVDSYKKIQKEIGLESSAILFLSDIKEELSAAKAAGMQVCQLVRDDFCEVGDSFANLKSLTDIEFKH